MTLNQMCRLILIKQKKFSLILYSYYCLCICKYICSNKLDPNDIQHGIFPCNDYTTR